MPEELTSGQASGTAAPSPETGGQAQPSGRQPQFTGEGRGPGRGESQPPQRSQQAGETPGKQAGAPAPATDGEQQKPQKGINLFEDENFRKVQSAWERQMQQLRQQNQELASRVRNSELKGLDDFEKLQYEKQELEQNIRQMQEQRNLEVMAYQRQQDIQRIATETGADASELEQASDYANAWERAALHLRARVQELEKQLNREEGRKKEANAPYLGGGASSAGADGDLSAAFDAAKRSRDPAAWARAVRESRSR